MKVWVDFVEHSFFGSHMLQLFHVIHLGKEYDQNNNEGLLISLGEKSFPNARS